MFRITFIFVILFITFVASDTQDATSSSYVSSIVSTSSDATITNTFEMNNQTLATTARVNLNSTNVTQQNTKPKLLFYGNDQKKQGLGVNLGPIDPFMSQWVFTNIFKHAREWRIMSTANNWATFTATGAIPTDWSSDGYPLHFSNPNKGYQTELGTGGVYPTGDYILTFQGTGNVSIVGDAQNVQQVDRNKFTFYVNQTTTKGIVVVITQANVTNIDLREAIDENRTETFGRNFTQAISPFEALRFSSWTLGKYYDFSKADANVNWASRRPATFYTQVGMHMVSIEYMVELANVLAKDMWLSIPKTANADFIQNMALYVKNNLNNKSIIYVEQSSDKGWMGQDRNLQMQLIQIWKSVFNESRSRLQFVLSTTLMAYFENVMTYYTDADLAEFDAYAVHGGIADGLPYKDNNFNVTQTVNYTTQTVLDAIRQAIYKDERAAIYQMNKIAVKLNKPMYAFNVEFYVSAPGYQNRFNKLPNAPLEQKFEDLIVESLRQPLVEDLLLDYFERWWKVGGGIMFLTNIVNRINRCENGGANCGYKSLMENLLQDPMSVPKYRAAIKWLNGSRSSLPFTSDDVPEEPPVACDKCVWGVCYNGTCSCYNGYTGAACDQQIQKYLDCASNKTEFGVNPDGIVDWSTAVTFVDLQRRGRKLIVQKMVFSTKWADWDQNDVQLRDDGYPKYLEIGKTVGSISTRDLHAHYPNGKYVILYDGDGALELMFVDTQVIRQDAGRIEMWVTHKTEMNNGIYYSILRTNPSNPIRNVRIMEAKFEKTYKYFPFHPLYLELMKKFQIIRYMPWSNVFLDQIVDWSNRTLNSYYSFATGTTGVSLEMQVSLANFLGINPWFNLPHIATDNYLRNLSIYIRDNLRPDVKIYFEIGNECWGSGGPHECGNYAERMGLNANMTLKARQNYYSKELTARICYHAKTGQYYFNIIKEIFGEANRTRLKFVLNTQAAWGGPLEVFFLCTEEYYKSYDIIAIAPYLSHELKKADSSLYSVEEVFNSLVDQAIKDAVSQVNNTANLIKTYAPTLELATYESGPDFSSLTDTGNVPLTNLSIAIHRDPRIGQAVANYIRNLTKINGVTMRAFNYFTASGTYTKYGCWGMIESTDANLNESPKYLAYMSVIDSSKICEWNEKPNNCENNCNSNGVCSSSPGSGTRDTCECFFGFNGTSCQSFNYIKSERCTYLCGGRGVCEFDHYEGFYEVHTCHCTPGYYGYGCGLFNCTNECNWNGKCVDLETCSCYRGYKGAKCEINCGCNGHGTCSNDTNTCVCDKGYKLVNGECVLDCTVDSARAECLKCSINCGNGTCVRGNCICWTGFKYDSRKSCRIPTNAPNDGVKLGVNLNGVVDWSPQWVFVDLIKQARSWIVQHIDNLDDLYLWSVDEPLPLTPEGYPASIPHTRQAVTLMLRDVRQRWPDGTYYLFHDGEGIIDFGFDAKVIESNEKYRMKIMVNLTLVRDNGVFMKIKKTNPKNPLRNIRIIMDGFQDTYQQIPFHPLFLEKLAPFRTLRFMDWTGQDGVIKWSDRVTPLSYAHHMGVAFEHQIQLANLLKKNVWITVPYEADDNFVREMAILFKNNLRKDVTINLEYSNEVWNSFFNSGKYSQKMGLAMGLSTDKTVAGNLFYSLRMQQIMTIWKDVFQNEKDRIVLVVGSFSILPVMSERILAYNNAFKIHTKEMLAITGYIDCGDKSAAEVVYAHMSDLFQECKNHLPKMRSMIAQHAAIAKKYNVSLGMYESGSGMMELATILAGSETYGATDKYIAMNRDIRFYDVYKDYYRLYDTFNMSENCHYAFIGVYSKYGPWLLLEYMDQSINEAHRYRAYLELINETRVATPNYPDANCFGMLYNKTEACNANGICLASDICECDQGFFGKSCVPFDASKPGEDLFSKLDSRILALLMRMFPSYTQEQIATLASNRIMWGPIIDANLTRSIDCNVRGLYFKYLEERLVVFNETDWVTFKRMNQTFDCKQDCNFNKILSTNSSEFNNASQFITQVLPYLNQNAASQCKVLYSSLFTISTSNLLNNIDLIQMVTPDKLVSISRDDSLKLAKQLADNKKTLPPAMAKSLADNLPANTPLDNIASIASQMPLSSIDNTSPNSLVNILPSMDINNMDNLKKNFIVNKIASSNNETLIKNMLTSSSDPTIINSIPAQLITSLAIDITNIPAANLPDAFLKNYSRTILESKNLSSISDPSTLSKILPGISRRDLNKIDTSAKVSALVNLVNASLSNGVPLTSTQRADMLANLLDALKSTSGLTDPADYLKNLTSSQLEVLYPLFIEANSTILNGLSKSENFSTVISQVASIASSKCCSYSRFARQLLASYAITYLVNSTTLTTNNLYALGPCLSSALSASYLQNMSPSVFVNYYSTNGGSAFQPNETETTVIQSLIASLALNYSSQDTYVFSTLNDLAMFYPFQNYSSSLSSWKTNGISLINKIRAARDPTDESIQLCRIGLTNNKNATDFINTIGGYFVDAMLGTTAGKRKKRSTTLTCTDINNIAGSLNSLTVNQISSLSTPDFISCQIQLGASSNSWTTAQLSALAAVAKLAYPTVSSISDTNISQLKSILLGFLDTDLQSLVFTSTSSISALGALSGWSSSQLTALATPITNYIQNTLGGTINNGFLTSAGNLVCTLTTNQVNSITNSAFTSSISALSKISLACPNIASFYALAKTAYGTSILTTAGTLSQIGTIINGVSQSEFAQISYDIISSISTTAWTYMPANIVNTMTISQLLGLSNSQLSALMNSPNYSQYSSVIQNYIQALTTGTVVIIASTSSSQPSSSVITAGVITGICVGVTVLIVLLVVGFLILKQLKKLKQIREGPVQAWTDDKPSRVQSFLENRQPTNISFKKEAYPLHDESL